MKPLIKLIAILLLGLTFIGAIHADETKKKTSRFIESFEWDSMAHLKIEKFKNYEPIYLKYINSSDEKTIYLGAVMLGLLKSEESLNSLKTIQSKDKLSEIGVLFALCSLKHNYSKNYLRLEELGKQTQDVAGANSIANLEVVELLSFLADPRFLAYASSLSSDETFQREAISVSIARYQEIYKNGF